MLSRRLPRLLAVNGTLTTPRVDAHLTSPAPLRQRTRLAPSRCCTSSAQTASWDATLKAIAREHPIAIALVCSVPLSAVAAVTLEYQSEATIKWRVEHGASAPPPKLPDITALRAPRDVEKQALLELFSHKPENILNYHLLQGPHAQGKTTLVQQAIQDGLQPKLVLKGAIYVDVPEAGNAQDLARAVSKAMDYDPAALYHLVLLFFQSLLGRNRPRSIDSSDPLQPYKEKLIEVATWFEAKHDHPLLLVIDNVNRLAAHDPRALENMRQFAKTMADRRLIRMVFVTEGLAPRLLKEGNTYRMSVIEMQDISLEEARKMLRSTVPEASDELINKVVCDMTGGRVLFVIEARRVMANNVGRPDADVLNAVEDALALAAGGVSDPRLSTKEAYKLAEALLAKHTSLPQELKCDIVNNATLTFDQAVDVLGTEQRVRELCAGYTFWLRNGDKTVSFQSAIAAHRMKQELNAAKTPKAKRRELLMNLDDLMSAARSTKP